jgi:folate-binding protein YgfZ
MEEYQALTESCGVSELPLSMIRIAGNDRAKFVHNFCTADIKKLETDSCCEAFFLNTKGKTICHGVVICREIDLLIVSTAKSPEVLIENLDRYLLSEDVQLSDVSAIWRSVFVFGPQSSVMLGECEVRVPSESKVYNTGFQLAIQAELAGAGVLILEPVDGDVQVAQKLIASGAVACLSDSFHLLRVQNQTPWCDSEITDKCLPQEFRRDSRAISFTKGCYLGQETVARLDALGHVNRYLAGFEILDGSVDVGDEIRKDEKKIGVVTSMAQTPDGKTIGLGFLKVEFAKPGEVVECDGLKLNVR